ncbi:hypothetical protein BGW38_006248 [Lunasporangiospora selenospora]|uniref:Dienelactone hydrolase domain-containing protein n=1 Tax=Lunasporangiospora selenospora TaxID=979761 RepID=A0A9P6FZV9_9FUNG|nr:hypothetical protein BGW38_006248 [Lunasporangiospora selenospora]
MLVKESHVDLPTSSGLMRTFIYQPNLPDYPQAKFPGVAVFTEIYQVTGPLDRFCRQIASQGYIVACNESFHEFEPLGSPLAYDVPGTGNRYKIEKELKAYDEDATVVIDHLMSRPDCTGKIGATGMCLGGHLAFRAAFDPRVLTSVCYFATDIHSETLGKGKQSDSLQRSKEIQGELVMIFGKQDNHVPRPGRDLIRKTLEDADITMTFLELQDAQHAFIRDELSKGRYDAAIAKVCFEMLLESFHRNLHMDLGPRKGPKGNTKDLPLVC